MRILLTGAAGFIGSHLLESLVKRHFDVVAVDNFDEYYDSKLKHNNLKEARNSGGFDFYRLDITDYEALTKIVSRKKPGLIIHLAARPGIRASFTEPILYNRINVRGTLNILEAARRFNVPRIIFASSSSVYGNARLPFRENDLSISPISIYGSTKLIGERYCAVYSKLFGIKVQILRFFTCYGPRQRPDMAIHKFASLIMQRKSVSLYAQGKLKRDYTYVSDIVDAILKAIKVNDDLAIYNIGNSRPITTLDVLRTLETELGIKAKIKKVASQPGDPLVTYADITNARKRLGYEPKVSFQNGIKEFVRWFTPLDNLCI